MLLGYEVHGGKKTFGGGQRSLEYLGGGGPSAHGYVIDAKAQEDLISDELPQ